ncbi:MULTISPECIES: ABC transporter ATP-binding protein [unclassified Mesotoga]|jgi:putative ABC transport system ATP-binding protein|uniref:ABC transporter ATP-binding protein n=1 Tax=unclassified Mesotoga TaxID=1184398 RepID=UPI000A8C783D|nr:MULTISPECIES: ATP-binding cassette domain-containing protein [unclassified Mesotoga]
MVEFKDLTVVYNEGMENERVALRNVSLTIPEGQFVTIVGPNGAGKSTLLKVILGEVQPTSGLYIIDDKTMNCMKPHRLAEFIGRVYQDPNTGIFPALTIAENLIIASKKGNRPFRFSSVKEEAITLLRDLGLGLEDRMRTKAGELSGGQKQSLAMVMAILSKPRLLLLDEHTAALDPDSASRVMELTARINREYEITIIMITHNMEIANSYGERLMRLIDGEVANDGIREIMSRATSVMC